MRYFTTHFMVVLTALIFTFFSSAVLAKEINLYEQPQDKSKIVGTVDLSAGIIPIYTPNNSDWMKVGDPRNGNVGWVKSNDINKSGGATFTFSQRIMNNGQGPHTYQIIEYGKPQNLTGEQMQSMIQKMQTQQKNVQKDIQSAVENMMKQLNSLYQTQMNHLNGTPVVMPILIIPAQTTNPANKKN